ncbi:hypothetical protein IQ07DRAFT_338290 [Pyrenochaeta sp. DS3sAY3a]|nr:hypothetical protein IQ07DRAFT_338290 [Pyrenochaeta sp. DS3sAY3a]
MARWRIFVGTAVSATCQVDVVDDEQPRCIVRSREPRQDASHHLIDIGTAVFNIGPACLGYLTLRDPASTTSDASLDAVLAPSVQPKNGAEPAVLSSCELHHQLRLAYSAKTTPDRDLLLLGLRPLRKQHPLDRCRLGRPVDKESHSRNVFQAEVDVIDSKIYLLFSHSCTRM